MDTTKAYLADLQLDYVTHNEIIGLDPGIAEFLDQVGFEPDHLLPLEHWDPITAYWTYLTNPMVVTPRKNGYCVLGSGRAWRQAEQLFEANEKFPVLILPARRLADELKLRILAADLFGHFAGHRTRPHLPKRMLSIWRAFNARRVPTIYGDDVKAFSRATGYSLSSLTPKKTKAKSASSVQGQLSGGLPEAPRAEAAE